MILPLILVALVLASTLMTLVWWRQLHTKNAGIVDAWWAYLFGIISLLFVLTTGVITLNEMIMFFMVMIWSVRLGTHLFIRNTGHVEEDIRYKKLRDEYGDRQGFLMWRFFMYQAISNVVLSAPFLFVAMNDQETHSPIFWTGVILWCVGIVGETVADAQLTEFKEKPTNKGKVCSAGLWKYSRHPNYFFEWLIWVAYATIACSAPYGWIAIYCPLVIYILLNKVTGIPMLEEMALKSKGDAYRQYQKTTSAFFPWFPKSK